MTLRIGIDLGGTKIEGIIIDDQRRILSRQRHPTPAQQGYEAILTTICDLVAEFENGTGQTCYIGLGTPGSIAPDTGLLRNSNTTCLNGQPIKADLERHLGRTVRVENDANCFALSEARHGAATGHAVVFGVIMGTGIGGGITVDRELLTGRHRIAGEWGHNVLEADGPLCYCGKRGCVETLLSGPGLTRAYAAAGGGIGVSAATIARRSDKGEPIATQTMHAFLDRFGKALAGVVNILDPDAIVLGGGLSNIDRLYCDGGEYTSRYVFHDRFTTPILRNKHGDSSGVLGAAELWPVTAVAENLHNV